MPSTFQKLQIYHSKPLFFFHFLHYLLYIQIPKGVSEFMGLHLMAVVKLKLLASTSHTVSLTPYITSLVAPFVVKTFLNFRTLPQLYEDVLHALRLFLFQFTQIRQLEDLGDRNRWERALRLLTERISRQSSTSDEASSLHELAMITL